MSVAPGPEAAAIIQRLALEPHPEGGFYRQTFADRLGVSGRPASTAIYYLLAEGERSHWHRIDAVETWHFYAGARLRLSLSEHGVGKDIFQLGPNVLAGDTPQVVVPRFWWQSAETSGAWTLVGCTVTPGFQFHGFELAPDDWQPA